MRRLIMMLGLLTVVGSLWGTSSSIAQESPMYVVEFRDGTVLQTQIDDHVVQWQVVSADGKITSTPVHMSEVAELQLVLSPITDRVRQIRKLIEQLGHPEYGHRETASRELIANGGMFRSMIEASQGSSDPEADWRLSEVLENIKSPGDQRYVQPYDRLQQIGADESNVLQGDAGDWSCQATYRGGTIELNRSTVRLIRRGALPPPESLADASVGERIVEADIEQVFPENRIHLDFELDSKGQDTRRGLVINDEYIGKGIQFQSSLDNGFVGIFEYKINQALTPSRSAGGQSEGTSSNDYEGVTTITFCVPEQPSVPATIHYFGCFLSIVEKDKTLLRFFDPQGRLITEQATLNESPKPTDFVGFFSPTPIARIEIHPTYGEDGDENYAFDDMLFDIPKAQSDAGNPELFSVVTTSGERLQSGSWQIQDDVIELGELTIGAQGVAVPRPEVASLIPQFFDSAIPVAPVTQWAQTSNGSLIRVEFGPQGAAPRLVADKRLPLGDLNAIWYGNVDAIGAVVFDEEKPPQFPVAVAGSQIVPLSDLELSEDRVVAKIEGPAEPELGYQTLHPIVLRPLAAAAPEDGIVRTVDDQYLVLDQKTFVLKSWDNQGVKLELYGAGFDLDWKKIRSIRLPAANSQ